MTDEKFISNLYSNFPKDSKANQSDNHWAFKQFKSDNARLGSHSFDNAILCLDTLRGSYTWHIVCNAYSLADIRFASEISGLTKKLKELRHGRELKPVEVVTRSQEHYFITSQQLD